MFEAIKKVLVYLQLAIGIVPQIIELVKAVELPGNGAAKFAAVIEIVKAAWELIPDEVAAVIGLQKVEAFVAKVVPIIVTLLNAAGIFKKG
jgi:hypothetical protein